MSDPDDDADPDDHHADDRPAPRRRVWPHVAALLWAAAVGAAVWEDRLPAWVGWAALGLSVFAFCLHGWDKWRAGRHGRRVPETVLHLVELLGGWPGALVARHLFRHKTVKFGYRVVFWLCALTNAGLLAWWVWSGGDVTEALPGVE